MLFSEKTTPKEAVSELHDYITKVQSFKKPLIGYLFQESNIIKNTQELKKHYPFFDIESPEKNIKLLNRAYDLYSFVLTESNEENFSITIDNLPQSNFNEFKKIDKCAENILQNKNLQKYLQLRSIRKKLDYSFQNQPKDIFLKSIHEVEDLVTAEMTHFLDQRIIEYVDNHATEANNLKTII